jgi:thioester reductase-like protein
MSTFWREVSAADVTAFAAPPTIYSFMHSLFEQRALLIGHAAAAEECKAVLGEHCSTVSVGGALTAPELLLWMRQLWGDKVVDGYGCTECGAIAHNGVLDPLVRVIIEPESEPVLASESAGDGTLVGTLWVHTRNCASSYVVSSTLSDEFRNIDELSVTGKPYSVYYNTGDRVRFSPTSRRLQVLGRAKSKLRLSNATFIDADAVQSAVSMSKKGFYDVGNVLITCRSSNDIVVAVVQIRSNVPFSSVLKNEILEEMHASCRTKNIPASWIPRHVVVDSDVWNVGNCCITASGKLQRFGIETRVAKELDAIFEASSPELLAPIAGLAVDTFLTCDILINSILHHAPVGISLNHELSLSENGCDSIRVAQLFSTLQRFKSREPISSSALHSRPIKALAALYCGENHSYDSRSTDAQSLLVAAEADTQIPHDLLSPMLSSNLLHQSKNGVFVTGASGFLGIHILFQILQQPQSFNVFCLVRGSSEVDALSRLKHQAATANLDICWSRVVVILGDLSLPLFGLHAAEFTALALNIDKIVHNGAAVHWLKDYHSLRASNVIGTHTCARLAHKAAVKSFVFVSSSSSITPGEQRASGKPGTSLLPLPVVAKMSGYGASKRVGEIFLCRFACQHLGMSLCILRPATIISSKSPPSYNLHDAFSRYIQACFLLRAVPTNDAVLLHFVPVDLVARLAVHSLLHAHAAHYSLLNILCGSGLPLSQVSRCIQSACSFDIQPLPLSNWLHALNANCPAPLQPLHHIFQRVAFPWSSVHDCSLGHDDTVILHDLNEEEVESSARWVAFNM